MIATPTGDACETVRDQQAWQAGFPGERARRARFLRHAHARPVHGRDRPGLRVEGAHRHRHPQEGGDRRLHRPVQPPARSRTEPLLGEPLFDDDVRQAAHPVAGPAQAAIGRLPPGAHAVGGRRGEGGRRRTRLGGPAAHLGRSRRAGDLRPALRPLPAQAPPRHRAARGEAHRGRVPRAPRRAHLGGARARSGLPRLRAQRDPRRRGPRTRARGAPAVGDGAAQPVPVGPLAHPAAAGLGDRTTTG